MQCPLYIDTHIVRTHKLTHTHTQTHKHTHAHTQVAELLLKAGAAVNTPSGSNNDIPLTSACWKGHHRVVSLLLQHGSQIEHRTKDGCTPLMLAARSVVCV